MRSITLPRGWYCDAAPDGRYVALILESHIETHAGRVELPVPKRNLLWLRIGPGPRIAGIDNGDNQCWEWDGERWASRGIAFGPRAVIYDAFGVLRILRYPGPAVGYRYIADDGQIISATGTRADLTRRIWEYTEHAGITVGQGGAGPQGDDPLIVLIDGARRLLEPGRCHAPNFSFASETAAIAFNREDRQQAMLRWYTRAELAREPLDVPLEPPPPIVIPPPVTPPDPPAPSPEPRMSIPHIGDDEIIELSTLYDRQAVNVTKSDEAYLRDAAYDAYGYARLRAEGQSHEDALGVYAHVSAEDARFDPPPFGMVTDDEIIATANVWTEAYRKTGRYQRQSRQENARDLTYYVILYAREREAGKGHGGALEAMRRAVASEDEDPQPHPIPAPEDALRRVQPEGKIFRLDGAPWRYKGVTAFKLLDRFASGEDIAPFVHAFPRYNTLRVFPYVPEVDWKETAWDSPAPAIVVDFLTRCAELGRRVELTLLTDPDPDRIQPAIELIRVLTSARPTNLFLEGANEPLTHTAKIDVAKLRPALEVAASVGIPYSSGVYEDELRVFGTYGTHHSKRSFDWPRRAHDAMEFYSGDGPNRPHPGLKMPWVLDEPIRPDQAVTYARQTFRKLQGRDPSDVETRAALIRDYRAYGGASALMGAGATFHSESGKFARLPDDEERACADALADGLEAFPADAPFGSYRRVTERGNESGGPTDHARTYVVGDFAVRCQQEGTDFPEDGWQAIDSDGVLWRR